jgi:lysophospholipase L1-like esterase
MPRSPGARRRAQSVLAALALFLVTDCGESPRPLPPTPLPLTITCPARIEAQSADGSPVPITLAQPQTSGGRAPVTVTCSTPPASFPVGSTTISCTANDTAGQNASCNYVVAVQGPPKLKYTRFLAFGDSLTAGVVSLGPSFLLVVAPDSYPAKLENMLRLRYRFQTPGPVVLNDGVPAEFTTEGLRRLRGVLQQHRPEVLLLMEGTNDLLDRPEILRGANTAIANLKLMIAEAKSLNVQVALATVPPQRSGGLRRRDAVAATIPGFNDRIRELAAAEGLVLVDVYNGMKDDMALIGLDDLHPTVFGYEVMAKIYFEAIQKGFEEQPPATARMPW